MNSQQQAFLQHIATLIPKLFDAIRLGNVKSECVLGDRIIGKRQVRLKLVAEVVDPGSNPLATHSQSRQNEVQALKKDKQTNQTAVAANQVEPSSSNQQRPDKQPDKQPDKARQPVLTNQAKPTPPRRGPRRNHPMSR